MMVAKGAWRDRQPQVETMQAPRPCRRKELWCAVAVGVAGAINTRHADVAGRWADAVLADYDERFSTAEQGE